MQEFKQLLILVVLLTGLSSCGYNNLVEMEENIGSQWAQVENVYERRANLVPLIERALSANEAISGKFLSDLKGAKKEVDNASVNASELTGAALKKFNEAQENLNKALNNVLSMSGTNPDLSQNQSWREAMAQLEGSENRIAVERRKFNKAVDEYNTYRNKLPQRFTAGISGFSDHPYLDKD